MSKRAVEQQRDAHHRDEQRHIFAEQPALHRPFRAGRFCRDGRDLLSDGVGHAFPRLGAGRRGRAPEPGNVSQAGGPYLRQWLSVRLSRAGVWRRGRCAAARRGKWSRAAARCVLALRSASSSASSAAAARRGRHTRSAAMKPSRLLEEDRRAQAADRVGGARAGGLARAREIEALEMAHRRAQDRHGRLALVEGAREAALECHAVASRGGMDRIVDRDLGAVAHDRARRVEIDRAAIADIERELLDLLAAQHPVAAEMRDEIVHRVGRDRDAVRRHDAPHQPPQFLGVSG